MLSRRQFVTATIASSLASLSTDAFSEGCTAGTNLIDSHVHVWKHDPAFPFAQGATPPAEDASVEMLLELMRTNHVARTVLIQVIHYRWDNSYLASALRRFPNLFQGVCRVNPTDPAAPDALARLTQEQGFRGVRLSPAAGPEGDWIRSDLMPPLWKRCLQLQVPMTLLLPASRLLDVEPLIRKNQELQVVIDHMADIAPGQPNQLSLLLALAQYANVFVKISHPWSLSGNPYPYGDMQQQIQTLHANFGADRLMWGTDWPISLKQLPYAKAVQLYRNHLSYLPLPDREQILYKTVQRVWPFHVVCPTDL